MNSNGWYKGRFDPKPMSPQEFEVEVVGGTINCLMKSRGEGDFGPDLTPQYAAQIVSIDDEGRTLSATFYNPSQILEALQIGEG